MKFLLSLIPLLAVLSGCASGTLQMYQGAPRLETEVAKVAKFGQDGRVWVRSIDGHTFSFIETDYAYMTVLPGLHSFGVEYRWGGGIISGEETNIVQVTESVLPGHVYVLHYQRVGQRIKFYFVDYGAGFPEACVPIAAAKGGPQSGEALKCVASNSK